MKRVCSIFLCVTLLLTMCGGTAFAKDIEIAVDGQVIPLTDAVPFADSSNRTQVPLRVLAEALGYGVEWDGETQSAFLYQVNDAGTEVLCFRYTVNEKAVESLVLKGSGFKLNDTMNTLATKMTTTGTSDQILMDTVPMVKAQRIYIPVRYVAELFGHEVNWNNEKKQVVITTK